LVNQLICRSMPVVILGRRFKTELPPELFRCQSVIDRFHQEVAIIPMAPYLHTAWVSLHNPIRDAVIEVVMGNHKVQIDIAVDDVCALVRFGEDHATRVDDSGFVGADGGYDVVVVEACVDLEGETPVVGRRPEDQPGPLLEQFLPALREPDVEADLNPDATEVQVENRDLAARGNPLLEDGVVARCGDRVYLVVYPENVS